MQSTSDSKQSVNKNNGNQIEYTINTIPVPNYDSWGSSSMKVISDDIVLLDPQSFCRPSFLYDAKRNTVTKFETDVIAVLDDFTIVQDGQHSLKYSVFDKNGKKCDELTKEFLSAKINLTTIINLGKNKFLSAKQEDNFFTIVLHDLKRNQFNIKSSAEIKTDHFHYPVEHMIKLQSGLIACLCERPKKEWVRGAKDNQILQLFEITYSNDDSTVFLKHLGSVFPHVNNLKKPGEDREAFELRQEGEYSLIWNESAFNLNSSFKPRANYAPFEDKLKMILLPDFKHYLSHKRYADDFCVNDIKTNETIPVKINGHKIKNFTLLDDGKVVALSQSEQDADFYISVLDFKFVKELRGSSYKMITQYLPDIPMDIAKIIAGYAFNYFPGIVSIDIPEQKTTLGRKIKNNIYKGLAASVGMFKRVSADDIEIGLRRVPGKLQDAGEIALICTAGLILGPFLPR